MSISKLHAPVFSYDCEGWTTLNTGIHHSWGLDHITNDRRRVQIESPLPMLHGVHVGC